MRLTCHAHNFEDVLLWRALRHVEHGRYIEVGGAAPPAVSTSQAFYARGWSGVNLQPAPAPLRALRIARPADTSLALGAGAGAGQADYYELAGTAGSTYDAALAAAHAAAGGVVLRHRVELQTLDQVCAEHVDGPIHFLALAGGAERAALAGLDLARWRPWIIVLRAAGGAALAELAAADYRLAHVDGLNHYYVAAEQAALAAALALPPHPADDFVLAEDHPYSQPLDGWRARCAAAEAAAVEAREWAQAHVREWRDKHALLTEQERRAERAQAALEQAAARAAAAEAELPGLRARAAQAALAEAALAGTYASLSWRLTRPLREGKLRLRRAGHWLRRLPARLRGAVLRRAKGLAGRALRFVTARPALSFLLRRAVSRLPFLVPAMRALKLRLQLNQNHAAAAAAPPAELAALPEAARRIFDDLRRASGHAPPT
ncbi:FkbM family methyltransferase [Rugamonas sp. DEMB1]|uniref:FkbM family methyltransferase n=1 Tax=Rugamonas sp. DEMB1 TaxID=3039386 RepID=UPI00244A0E1C|nr:FkbM family methyltransferase [Rugamonas sp. DEMB1]WGG51375.1 hypothetical protein QC826_03655 [Rugamonas sp. DEMB1]